VQEQQPSYDSLRILQNEAAWSATLSEHGQQVTPTSLSVLSEQRLVWPSPLNKHYGDNLHRLAPVGVGDAVTDRSAFGCVL